MMTADGDVVGRIAKIWRYPVKSMGGEEIREAAFSSRGLVGDRDYALLDAETGKVVTAKNPRHWPNLLDYSATFAANVTPDSPGVATIVSPSGESIDAGAPDASARLSRALGRPVRFVRGDVDGATAEGFGADDADETALIGPFEFPLPLGTFFDCASVHALTTATLAALARDHQGGASFDVRRFRPNLLIESSSSDPGFVEDAWIGRRLKIAEVTLRIDMPCPRCIMTTLPQRELAADRSILRTAVKENFGNVGVYAAVETPGTVRPGDVVRLQ